MLLLTHKGQEFDNSCKYIVLISGGSDMSQRKEIVDVLQENGKLSQKDIAEKMRTGEIKGTFYVNYPEEKADASNLVTKKKCYSE